MNEVGDFFAVNVFDSDALEVFSRLQGGMVRDGKAWRRISVVDLSGRVDGPFGVLTEARAGGSALAWYSRFYQADALAALPSLGLPGAEVSELSEWIASTAYVEREGGAPETHFGSQPRFSRGRSIWPQAMSNSGSWGATLRAFFFQAASGSCVVPFESRAARDGWMRICRSMEADPNGEPGLDYAACRKAIAAHPYLAA